MHNLVLIRSIRIMSEIEFWGTWEEIKYLQQVRNALGDEVFDKLTHEEQQEKAALCYLADILVITFLEQEGLELNND